MKNRESHNEKQQWYMELYEKDIEKHPEKVLSRGYDLVLNGFEIAGGSIRNHNLEIQNKIFRALKIDEKEAQEKFGHLLDSMKYGAPPIGGFAIGLDRVIAIMAGEETIREVIAFPKNKDAKPNEWTKQGV